MSFPVRESAALFIEDKLRRMLPDNAEQVVANDRIDWRSLSRSIAEGLYRRGLLILTPSGVPPEKRSPSPPDETPFRVSPPDDAIFGWRTVQGRCPACGRTGTLFLGSQGHITCSYATCPNPGAATDQLLDELFDPDPDLEIDPDAEEDEEDLDGHVPEDDEEIEPGLDGQDDGADEEFSYSPPCGVYRGSPLGRVVPGAPYDAEGRCQAARVDSRLLPNPVGTPFCPAHWRAFEQMEDVREDLKTIGVDAPDSKQRAADEHDPRSSVYDPAIDAPDPAADYRSPPRPPLRSLSIALTEEQARLYSTSATFKAHTDALIERIVPTYLDGLAARAPEVDAWQEQRIRTLTENTQRMFDTLEQRLRRRAARTKGAFDDSGIGEDHGL